MLLSGHGTQRNTQNYYRRAPGQVILLHDRRQIWKIQNYRYCTNYGDRKVHNSYIFNQGMYKDVHSNKGQNHPNNQLDDSAFLRTQSYITEICYFEFLWSFEFWLAPHWDFFQKIHLPYSHGLTPLCGLAPTPTWPVFHISAPPPPPPSIWGWIHNSHLVAVFRRSVRWQHLMKAYFRQL